MSSSILRYSRFFITFLRCAIMCVYRMYEPMLLACT
jgi:hypothetical protein